jgi:hypothetical protein
MRPRAQLKRQPSNTPFDTGKTAIIVGVVPLQVLRYFRQRQAAASIAPYICERPAEAEEPLAGFIDSVSTLIPADLASRHPAASDGDGRNYWLFFRESRHNNFRAGSTHSVSLTIMQTWGPVGQSPGWSNQKVGVLASPCGLRQTLIASSASPHLDEVAGSKSQVHSESLGP